MWLPSKSARSTLSCATGLDPVRQLIFFRPSQCSSFTFPKLLSLHILPTLGRSPLTRCVLSETRSIPLRCSCRTRQRRGAHTLGLWCTLPTGSSRGYRPPCSQRGGGPGRQARERISTELIYKGFPHLAGSPSELLHW